MYIFLICLLVPFVTFAYEPWFTGPLLIPAPTNAAPSTPVIEPTVTVLYTYGKYQEDWSILSQTPVISINPLFYLDVGITERVGFEFLLSSLTNFKKTQTASALEDTILLFGYQISFEETDSWIPDLRIALEEVFPTGKFEKLNPVKEKIDATGLGSFQTGPVLIYHKTFPVGRHYFALYASAGYLFPSKVSIRGENTYVGGPGTQGEIMPGQTFIGYISGEYSINQRWVFAFDTQYLYIRNAHFTGLLDGKYRKHHMRLPEVVQISIAPEIEYNLSPTSGILAGAWLTVCGKNAPAFASAFLAYLYVF